MSHWVSSMDVGLPRMSVRYDCYRHVVIVVSETKNEDAVAFFGGSGGDPAVKWSIPPPSDSMCQQ